MNMKFILSLALILISGFGSTRLHAADADLTSSKLVDEFKNSRVFWQQFEIAQNIVEFHDMHDTNIVSELSVCLTNDDRHARGNAAFVFAATGDGRGFEILREILTDKSARPKGQGVNGNWTVAAQIATDRYYAVHLFGDLKNSNAVPILIPLLQDKEVRDIVPWSLGQIGDRRAIEPLIRELNDKDPSMCVLAIDALGQLQAAEALPRLRELSASQEKGNFGDLISVGEAANAATTKIFASKTLNGEGPALGCQLPERFRRHQTRDDAQRNRKAISNGRRHSFRFPDSLLPSDVRLFQN